MKRFLAFGIAVGGSILISHLVNYLIVVPCVIGDECGYDVGKCDRGKVFELLFEQSSDTGYHPEPTLFNFFFVTLIGAMVGICIFKIIVYYRLPKRKVSQNCARKT
jgi:polysaccharide biosynthesis protein